MRIIFSRKGFDSASGGAPSPIVNGCPISLPIPTQRRSQTTYDQLGLGELVERSTRDRVSRHHLCHEDPMFFEGRCAFGQTGPSQSHLSKNGVGFGDVFLFFGLFADEDGRNRHHRIFGYLCIEEVVPVGSQPRAMNFGFPRVHPHFIGEWSANNTVYLGKGGKSILATDELGLSRAGGRPTLWRVPAWLKATGLTYHASPARWPDDHSLRIVSRGQEFVAEIGDRETERRWLDNIIRAIEA